MGKETHVKGVSFDRSEYEVTMGQKITLSPIITPVNFTDIISYKSTNTNIMQTIIMQTIISKHKKPAANQAVGS